MNYYERHIGDYARDTGHLSILEHGVYTLLLDRYYATEAPIPADQAHRIARARSKEEVKAVDVVLSEFFLLADGSWSHRRCDEEIEKARVRIWNAKANGTKGGRPRKDNPEKPSGLSVGSQNETQTKPLQAPGSIHQLKAEQGQKIESAPQAAPDRQKATRIPETWEPSETDLAFADREAPSVDAKREAVRFRDYWLSKSGKDATSPNWSARWRTWISRATEFNASRPNARASPQQGFSMESVMKRAEEFADYDFGAGNANR